MSISISSAADLYGLMTSSNIGPGGSWPLNGSYILTQDIDMSSYTSVSIGSNDPSGNGFTGSFDGQNHIVIITQISNTYSAFFAACIGNTNNVITHITVKYNNQFPPVTTFNCSLSYPIPGGLIGISSANTTVSYCKVVFSNYYTMGSTTTLPFASGGFIGVASGIINNCTLECGNYFKILKYNFGGFFIGINNANISDCNIILGNNCIIDSTSGPSGGISGTSSNIARCTLTIGDNCTIRGGDIGLISGQLYNNITIENCIIKCGDSLSMRSFSSGQGLGSLIGLCDDNIILRKSIALLRNTVLLGQTSTVYTGGIIGNKSNALEISNCFALYNDYSIRGRNANAIIGIGSVNNTVLSNSCGVPISGSHVTDMSTTSLNNILDLIANIPFLATVIPYIQQNYCYIAPIVVSNVCTICPTEVDLNFSNPQVTNYNESEDKSNKEDKIVRSDYEEQILKINQGLQASPMPLFKTYQDLMNFKNGALRWRR
jgi:hypothetical protein